MWVGNKLLSPDVKGKLEVKWLHGAPGKNLKAEFDVTLTRANTTSPSTTNMFSKNRHPTYTSGDANNI